MSLQMSPQNTKYTHIYIYVYTCIYTYIHIYKYNNKYTSTDKYKYTSISINKCTHFHTYTI